MTWPHMKPPPSLHRALGLVLLVMIAVAIARMTPEPDAYVIATERERRMHTDAGVVRIDPNTATAPELEALPGVGPAIAARIVAARARGQRFRRPEDLLSVRGIGPRTLARMIDAMTFGAGATGPR